jgi:hypothetical protein
LLGEVTVAEDLRGLRGGGDGGEGQEAGKSAETVQKRPQKIELSEALAYRIRRKDASFMRANAFYQWRKL